MKKTRQILRYHVSTHESEVDPQEIWDGILEKQKPKKKASWFRFLFSSVLLATIITATYLILANQDEIELYSESTSVHSEKLISNQLAPRQLNLNTYQSLTSDPTPIKSNTKNKSVVSNTSFDSIVYTKLPSQATSRINSKKSNQSIYNYNHSSLLYQRKNVDFNSIPQKHIASATTLLDKNEEHSEASNTELSKLELPSRKHNIVGFPEDIPIDINLAFSPPAPPITSYSPNILSLRLSGGIGITRATLSSNAPMDEDFVTARNKSESSLEIISGRIGLSYNLTPRLSIISGFDYLQINESFRWSGIFLQDSDGVETASLERDDEGNLDVTADLFTEDFQHVVDKDIFHYNKYLLISIPLILEYNFSFNKLRPKVYAGTSLNLLDLSRGRILDRSLLPIDLANLDTSFSNRYVSGLTLDFLLRRNLRLSAGLEFSSQSLTISDVQKQYTILSANLGLQFRIK